MNKTFKYLFIIFSFLSLVSHSQNETKKWYFGYLAGLDFMTNPPTTLANSQMTVDEGCASVADNNGNLLFYTDGMTIWTQTHTVMANGTGLLGGHSSTQASVILKKPGSTNLYYVFTVIGNTWFQGLNYSIVDMSLAGGQGSVTVKNSNLYSGGLYEKLAAAKHCNGTDYWIMVRDYSSSNMSANGNFYAYQFGATGVNTVAVVSPFTYTSNFHMIGCMKISPNGKRIACSNYDFAPHTTMFELFDFNSSTGVVSNSLALANTLVNNVNSFFASGYGVEFSPDCSKLYGTAGNFYATSSNGNIYEWDLCAGSNSAIAASQTTLAAANGTNYFGVGTMQLASNGKIYIAHSTNNSNVEALSVINNPNAYGAACGFAYGTQTVNSYSPHWGLPNFSSHYFLQHPPTPPPFTYTANTSFGCLGAGFTAPAIQNTATACTAATYSINAIAWNFGDPLSGSNNTSFLNNPNHIFSSPGTYTTELILYYNCGGGTDTLRQLVSITGTSLNISSAAITCSSLGSGSVSLSSGSGNYSYSWAPTSQSTALATGLIPGFYTVTAHDNALNCTVTNTVYFSPLVPLTGTLSNSPTISCNAASTGVAFFSSMNGGSLIQYYNWTNGVTSYTQSTISTLSQGAWSVNVTDALTYCQINETFTITAPPPLTLTISAASPTACAESSITLNAFCSGGTGNFNYFWSNYSTNSITSVSNSSAGTQVYMLTCIDSNSCIITQTKSIQYVPKPVINVSSVLTCPFQLASISATGASSYTWSGSNTFSANTNSLMDIPTINTTYTVAGTALGCTNTATGSINLKPIPSFSITSNSPVCEASTLTFAVNTGTAFNWQGPNNYFSTSKNNSINPITVSASGIYSLTVTALNACTASLTQSITVKALPIISFTNANQTICAGVQNASLIANTNAISFTWSPILNLNAINLFSTVASPSASKIYSLSATLNGCVSKSTTTVNVISAPNLGITLSQTSVCAEAFNNSPNSITATAAGANTYTWLSSSNFSLSAANGISNVLSSSSSNYTGVNTITLQGSNGICSVSKTRTLEIIPNPTVLLNATNPTICAGESVTLTASGAINYFFTTNNSEDSLLQKGSSAIVKPSVSKTKLTAIINVYGESFGCYGSSQTSIITVKQLPELAVSPNNTYICKGSAIKLEAFTNGTTITWQPNLFLNSSTGNTVIANPTANQNYTAVSSLNNCSNTAAITISVMPLPNPTIIAEKTKLCLNQTLSLNAHGANYYVWHLPNGMSETGENLNYKIDNLRMNGVYVLTATDLNFCSNSSSINIQVDDLPKGNLLGANISACIPFCNDFKFKPFQNINLIQQSWNIENETFYDANFSYCFSKIKPYIISGVLTDINSCVNTVTYSINGIPQPTADFIYTPEKPIESFDKVFFTNNSKGNDNINFEWFFSKSESVHPSNNPNAEYLFETAGNFPVALIVENKYGCKDTVVKTIKVEQDYNFFMPNSFTPNGDKKNEKFMPVTRGVKFYSFSVFNRWGKLIFETNDINNGWDGTNDLQDCPPDVYVWKVSITTFDATAKEYAGDVNLYR